jgi:hypothetical protein
METHCSKDARHFKDLGTRRVVADFSGGTMTSDAGALLLEKADDAVQLLHRAAACFVDHRDPALIEHSVADLIRQRVFGLALGYEDLNDHDDLSHDPLLAAVVGKADPTGQARRRLQDQDRPLAGKSTLNRMELTQPDADSCQRYKKIALDRQRLRRVFVDVFLEAYAQPPEKIILDFDATDDPLHGKQEGRFFHGYYKEYCYLPLYAFCGNHLLAAELRTADIDASAGTVDVLAWLVPEVLGLAKNSRLTAMLAEELSWAKARWEQTGRAARVYKDFGMVQKAGI